MFNPLNSIEKKFYEIRDFFWNYPDYIFGPGSISAKVNILYKSSMPYSHFAFAGLCVILIFLSSFVVDLKALVKIEDSTLVEGVVMGADDSGSIQKLTKVNPIIPSNVQIERDLSELIYEPLIRYEYDQSSSAQWNVKIEDVLAENVIKIREGADYQFNLRRNVLWHDGKQFTADDVIRTFDIVSGIENRSEAYITAIKQLRWEKLDDFTVRVCTRGTSDANNCNQTKDNPILSNFLELISIKIIPAHKSQDINSQNIDTTIPELFRSPVGTGKYKFYRADDQSVKVVRNDKYYGEKQVLKEPTLDPSVASNYNTVKILPKIQAIEFKFFRDLNDAITGLQNGTVHTLATISTESKQTLDEYPQIKTQLSPVLVNQYWSMYFNLRKDPNGKTLGADFFQDVKVRTAISYAINRQDLVSNALQGIGEEAFGPIPTVSEYFDPNAQWKTYNPDQARKLLDEAGWTIKNGSTFRTNSEGREMSFSLYYVNSYDRVNVAKFIERDLELVGIKAIVNRTEQPGQDSSPDAPSGWSLQDINNQFLSPRLFDAILYGMNTFIDPDRYELFHSSQEKTGLNISGYVGTAPTVRPKPASERREGESSLITLPKVDALLDETRRLDPEIEKDKRNSNYDTIQELIAEDVPEVFLYHPQFIYYANSRVKNVDLHNVSSLETRFTNIENFEVD
ncbi:MAG: ABC transporter substrate-binding protein [Candidatus Dojkabacteria bacterium]